MVEGRSAKVKVVPIFN